MVRLTAMASDVGYGRESTWSLRATPASEWVMDTWQGSARMIAVRTTNIRGSFAFRFCCCWVCGNWPAWWDSYGREGWKH